MPGKSHGQRSLVGYSPWGCKESDMTEQLHFHFSLSCIGSRKWQPTPVFLAGEPQGRGNLVGCRLWVAQSQTRLKQLSSSSSSNSWLLINLKQFPMPGLFITLEPLELNRKQYVNKHPILRTLLLTGNLCSSFLY